jgi:acyl-coenzyme A thioesterase PaaI-like protein
MTIRGNHIYDHLGVHSRRLSEESAETLMPVNDDIRVSGGLRAAPLGLAFEQGVASYLFEKVMAVPSQISLHVRDSGAGVSGIRAVTRLVRLGRTLVVTDGEIHDEADPGRMLAYGSIAWSVIGEAPAARGVSGALPDRPPFEPAGFDVIDAANVTRLPDGSGCQVAGITAQTTGPGGILHAGMFQLLCEEAALSAAETATGASELHAVDCTYNFLQPGKTGPFVATAEVLYTGVEGVDARVTVRDVGNDDRVPALAFVRVRLAPAG